MMPFKKKQNLADMSARDGREARPLSPKICKLFWGGEKYLEFIKIPFVKII